MGFYVPFLSIEIGSVTAMTNRHTGEVAMGQFLIPGLKRMAASSPCLLEHSLGALGCHVRSLTTMQEKLQLTAPAELKLLAIPPKVPDMSSTILTRPSSS